MSDLFRTIIVAAPIVEQARALAASYSNGQNMYQTPLTPDGTNVTHYISSGLADAGVFQFIPWKVWSTDENGDPVSEDFPGDLPGMVESITPEGGEPPFTLEQLQGMLAFVDVSTQKPRQAMARLGLSIFSEE